MCVQQDPCCRIKTFINIVIPSVCLTVCLQRNGPGRLPRVSKK